MANDNGRSKTKYPRIAFLAKGKTPGEAVFAGPLTPAARVRIGVGAKSVCRVIKNPRKTSENHPVALAMLDCETRAGVEQVELASLWPDTGDGLVKYSGPISDDGCFLLGLPPTARISLRTAFVDRETGKVVEETDGNDFVITAAVYADAGGGEQARRNMPNDFDDDSGTDPFAEE